MGREWRRDCPRRVTAAHHAALLGTSLYLLRQTGPTAFVIQEENKKDPVKVFLGERHTCSCRDFTVGNDLCIHIAWVLLKKLRLQPSDPLSYQTGLTEREMNGAAGGGGGRRPAAKRPPQPAAGSPSAPSSAQKGVSRRPLQEGDTCPICLDDMTLRQTPVVHCRYGCGRGVHLACIEVLMRHHRRQQGEEGAAQGWGGERLSCPLCRGVFCSKRGELVPPRAPPAAPAPVLHPQAVCRLCLGGPPLSGPIFKCLQCPQVVVCSKCLEGANFKKLHSGHRIGIRKDPGDHWSPLLNPMKEPVRVDERTERLVLPEIALPQQRSRSRSQAQARKPSFASGEISLPELTVGPPPRLRRKDLRSK